MQQLELFNRAQATVMADCSHNSGFHTNAYVPGGTYCTDCHQVVIRDMPPPENEPDLIGYVSANWAWKYKHGNKWTRDCAD